MPASDQDINRSGANPVPRKTNFKDSKLFKERQNIDSQG